MPDRPINDVAQVFEEPQVKTRGIKAGLDHPVAGKLPTMASPMRFSATPVEYKLAPPVPGQHTEEILRGLLQKTDAEIARLRADGAVWSCANRAQRLWVKLDLVFLVGGTMDAPRWKLPAIIAAVILIGGTFAAIFWMSANNLEGAPGFFGPAPLIADINLSLEILLLAGLTFGLFLARRGNIDAHKYNQTTWVLLNMVLVAFIMAGSMQDVKPAKLADISEARIGITWLHALAGSFTVAGGLWIVLQMNGILPKSWRIKWWKNLMCATLAGYWVVAIGGFVTYYYWYIG